MAFPAGRQDRGGCHGLTQVGKAASRRLIGCVRETSPELYQNDVKLASLSQPPPHRPRLRKFGTLARQQKSRGTEDVNWERKIRIRTHDPQFLWRMVALILASGCLVGAAVDWWFPQGSTPGLIAQVDEVEAGAPNEFDEALERRDWWAAWWAVGRMLGSRGSLGILLLALFAGGCWFMFCWHLAYDPHGMRVRTLLCCAAVGLGVLSVWPTLFLSGWQRVVWGIESSRELVAGLRFYIAGVGLREELCKLLCLLPLVPFLVRRGNPLECLVVSSCVGLGFAIEENLGYFSATAGMAAIGRFLTANFFHMSTAGLVGLALCRAVWYPAAGIPQFLLTFVVMVFIHGIYDSLIALPQFADYAFAALVIYILLSYRYFHEVRSLRPVRRETFSLTANLLLGVSCVTATTFIFLCTLVDWNLALRIVGGEALSLATMVYMFLREVPGSLVSV